MDGGVPTDGEEEAAMAKSVCIGVHFKKASDVFLAAENDWEQMLNGIKSRTIPQCWSGYNLFMQHICLICLHDLILE